MGYNAFDDYFPKYPLTPNPECTDKYCLNRQHFYSMEENASKRRKPLEESAKPKEAVKEIVHDENEWGITLDGGEESQPIVEQKDEFVEVKKE